MFGIKKSKNTTEDSKKEGQRSIADSRFASGDFGGHALSDSQLGRTYGGVNSQAKIECPKCHSLDVKTKLRTIDANGPVYQNVCGSCQYKWDVVETPTSM